MTPRPRKRNNKDLPENLYSKKSGGRNYYQYRHPVTGKFTGFGYSKVEAISAAKQLNQLLLQRPDLINKVIGNQETFADYLDYYSQSIMPKKRINGHPLSRRTLQEYTRIIKTISAELGHIAMAALRQSHIADYLSTRSSAEVYNKHRTLMVMICRQAVSDEKLQANLAERIVKRDADLIKRQPLSLTQYEAIYAHARPAIRNAMELSLNALQRRSDVQQWRFDSKAGDYYRVIIQKTKKHGKDSMIEIPGALPVAFSAAGANTLDDLVRNCRDDMVCPYLVHEKPKRKRDSQEKQHGMQLSPEQISRGFAQAREAAGILMDSPPTFHELLALGESLRKQQGWTLKQIQSLRGHRKEKTTQDYLDRQVTWTRIELPEAGKKA